MHLPSYAHFRAPSTAIVTEVDRLAQSVLLRGWFTQPNSSVLILLRPVGHHPKALTQHYEPVQAVVVSLPSDLCSPLGTRSSNRKGGALEGQPGSMWLPPAPY